MTAVFTDDLLTRVDLFDTVLPDFSILHEPFAAEVHQQIEQSATAVAQDTDTFIPDIITFAVGEEYLNRTGLYPKQATFLKMIFLGQWIDPRTNTVHKLFTQFDLDTIDEWRKDYRDSNGEIGVPDDIHDRIAACLAEGRTWFREVLAVIGRRGSKGFIGAIAGAYIVYHYLKKVNPQGFYGVDSEKRLSAMVFAGKRDQAKSNQWRDLVQVILGAPCFERYIGKPLAETLTINTPHDLEKIAKDKRENKVKVEMDRASIEIAAKESTLMAGRGPTGFLQIYDEMAHVVNSGANRSATEVYDAATPALAQFGFDAFIYEPSSPWQQIGKFYENFLKAIERVAEDGISEGDDMPSYPEMLVVILESWRLYEGWEIADQTEMLPRDYDAELSRRPTNDREPREDYSPHCGEHFKTFRRPLMSYDRGLQQLERANPETFKVEYRARWASVLDAYLNPVRIEQIWQPWPDGRELVMQNVGRLATQYKAHGDPSKSGANFGWAIAHIEYPEVLITPGQEAPRERQLPHVVFDKLHAWQAADFEYNLYEIDYRKVEEDIKADLDAFQPAEVSFDQFNSILTMQNLREHVIRKQYAKPVSIFERTATHGLNWEVYETFKTALNLGLVHAPYFELAELELKFLQKATADRVDHPSSGPVQTKDVADCMAIVVWALIGEKIAAYLGEQLGAPPIAGMQGGVQPFGNQATEEQAYDPARQMGDFGAAVGERARERMGRGDRARGRYR